MEPIINSSQSSVYDSTTLVELLSSVALKDQKAFAKLYDLTSAKLYGVILRILVREGVAQECLQECYIKIWQQADRYRANTAKPMTWLMTIARNQAIDLLRKESRVFTSDEIESVLESIEHDMDSDSIEDSERDALMECMSQLSQEQRQTIAMAYFKGLTHDQMSKHLGSPLGSVKTWIRRGLEQLKRCLGYE